MDGIGRERGWQPMSRAAFESSRRPEGANFVGSPAEVAEKILALHAIFNHDRFLIQFSVGTLPHADVMRSIELFGTEVAPLVRRELTPAPSPR
ncbi:MAG: Luciferase-like monooxygenase [Solirubrobacterales bacterium]|nr:Luciferase-like monooxygenase [Solirubrobacterales bacterium]